MLFRSRNARDFASWTRSAMRPAVEVHVEVADGAWLRQMMSMQAQLAGEMARIAGVKVVGIHFEVKGQKNRRGEEAL